jgi:hypothetical protein
MTPKGSSMQKESLIERLCGRIFGHKYNIQELRHYGVLDTYGKVYDICSRCGKHHFLGWKRSLSDPEYISLEDDGTPWYEVSPWH